MQVDRQRGPYSKDLGPQKTKSPVHPAWAYLISVSGESLLFGCICARDVRQWTALAHPFASDQVFSPTRHYVI